MTGPARHPVTPAGVRLLVLCAVAAAYFVSGKIGLSLAFVNESTTAVWPPAGIALAALLLCGLRVWPAVTAGAFLVNVTTSQNVAASLAIAAGNTLEVVAAAWAAQRAARGLAAFDRTPDILRFVALSALGATTIAATSGTASLLAAGLASRADASSIWLTWWLGDAAGIMMFTPLLVLWTAPGRQPWTAPRAIEALVLAAALIVTSALVFGDSVIGQRHLQLQFLTIPLMLWAAFRFGGRETATAATVLSVFAIRGTLDGLGPFAGGSPNQSLLILQGFIGVNTMVMLAVAAEVSGRWRVEAESRALNEALERQSRAKDQFLAMLSHELRTPLNVALGWMHIVRGEERGLDARARRAIDTTYRNLQMLTRLVSDIIDVSRISAGSLTLDLAEVDVRELVQAAVDTVRQPAHARRITIDTRVAAVIPPLRGDGGRLQQVVWNLLSNAVKFAPDGGRVTLSVTADGGAVQIVVEDDGPGIAPGFLPHVFEQFRQADASTAREHGGLGLGLSIARHLVQLHGGSITAGNRDAGGAVFTVRLPVDAAAAWSPKTSDQRPET